MNKKLEYLKKVSKVQKHNLGAINVLQDALDEMEWDDRLNSVYEKYEDARNHAVEILGNAQAEIQEINARTSDIFNTLKDLGLDETQEFIDLQNEANRILRQVQGLSEDLNSGVLA
tara:strand:- start:10104 stop:10451 length:348 start_codon:yes stop_codon:yes gene_type:complete